MTEIVYFVELMNIIRQTVHKGMMPQAIMGVTVINALPLHENQLT